jgi:hypothetical protein
MSADDNITVGRRRAPTFPLLCSPFGAPAAIGASAQCAFLYFDDRYGYSTGKSTRDEGWLSSVRSSSDGTSE